MQDKASSLLYGKGIVQHLPLPIEKHYKVSINKKESTFPT